MSNTIIFIDNFDSFTYNLVDEFLVLGFEVLVYRTAVDPDFLKDQIKKRENAGDRIVMVLSPGPSTPDDANNLLKIIRDNLSEYPMLGICLGHQALGQVLGGKVTKAASIVHGKSSLIEHCQDLFFKDLPNPLKVARYHSLIVTDLPSEVRILSTFEDMCMAFYSEKYRVAGFQFHPESIMSTYGRKLLENTLSLLLEDR